jgi:DNA-binding winged helix-turn-helix (wHTH) protein
MKHGQTPVSRDKLYFEIYGNDPAKSDSTINPYISKLRRILSSHSDNKEAHIKTIPKGGYQFVAPFIIEKLEIVEPTTIIRQVTEPESNYQTVGYDKFSSQPKYKNIAIIVIPLLIVTLALTFLFMEMLNSKQQQPILKKSVPGTISWKK